MLRLIRVLAFLVLAVSMTFVLAGIYRFSDNVHSRAVWDSFYDLPKDTLDAVWVGSSAVQEYWAPSEGYAETGVAMYGLATGNQPVSIASNVIRECVETQHPALILYDVRSLAYPKTLTWGEAVRRVTANMRPSANRLAAIQRAEKDLAKADESFDEKELSYYFDFLLFHSRRDLTSRDFGVDNGAFLGHWSAYDKIEPHTKDEALKSMSSADTRPDEESMKALDELLDYCDSTGTRIVFTNVPNVLSPDEYSKFNYVGDYVQSRGYEYIDYGVFADEIGINYATDFKNSGHLNMVGSLKFTRWLSRKLAVEYGFADHRGESGYKMFDEAHERYVSNLREQERKKDKGSK